MEEYVNPMMFPMADVMLIRFLFSAWVCACMNACVSLGVWLLVELDTCLIVLFNIYICFYLHFSCRALWQGKDFINQ